MKLLIAITTCFKIDNYVNDQTVDWWDGVRCKDPAARREACRSTWINDIPSGVEYRFFFGDRVRPELGAGKRVNTPPPLPMPLKDEVFLPCGDWYIENSAKVKAICNWAYEREYDYIVRMDDDCYVYPDRLLKSDWQHDYAGAKNMGDEFHPGGGLVLSRRAQGIVKDARITTWADDVWIGRVMKDHHFPMHTIPEFFIGQGEDYIMTVDKIPADHKFAMLHSCHPHVMKQLWERDHGSTNLVEDGSGRGREGTIQA